MLSKFKEYFQKQNIDPKDHKFLLAVSGGPDSMALLEVFRMMKSQIQVAHVNYNLRRKESIDEQNLVENYCLKHNITFHFKTIEYGHFEGKNVQIEARNIRYNFFQKILQQHSLSFVCTAHHLSDSLETSLINLQRGTGIKGIRGIPIRTKNILRPLSNCTRTDIDSFMEKNKVDSLQDSSNSTNDYTRNFFRNEIITRLETNNPNLLKGYLHSKQTLENQSKLLDHFINNWRNKHLINEDGLVKIPIKELVPKELSSTLLFELISLYGFTFSQCQDLLHIDTSNSAYFNSSTHEALLKSAFIFIRELKKSVSEFPTIIYTSKHQVNSFDVNPNIEIIDAGKVNGKFSIRKVAPGDTFQPFGMKGKSKLILEFLNQEGVLKWDKEYTYVLYNNEIPVWVIGHRLDHRFCIDPQTKEYLQLSLKPNPT